MHLPPPIPSLDSHAIRLTLLSLSPFYRCGYTTPCDEHFTIPTVLSHDFLYPLPSVHFTSRLGMFIVAGVHFSLPRTLALHVWYSFPHTLSSIFFLYILCVFDFRFLSGFFFFLPSYQSIVSTTPSTLCTFPQCLMFVHDQSPRSFRCTGVGRAKRPIMHHRYYNDQLQHSFMSCHAYGGEHGENGKQVEEQNKSDMPCQSNNLCESGLSPFQLCAWRESI